MKTKFWTMLLAGATLAAMPLVASAQEEGTKTARELRASYDKALQGKTIAYLPIALGVPLSDEWGRVVQEEAEWRGMKYIVRDPNNNPSAMQQALTALVDQKPDVLIVQNPSVTLTVNSLQSWLGVPFEAAQRILSRLASSGLVREVQRGVWTRGTWPGAQREWY